MIVHVEVINRPLDLRGPTYSVGERLGIDTDNPLHAAVLGSVGWVKPVTAVGRAPETVPAVSTAALKHPPVNRMVQQAPNKAVAGKPGPKPGVKPPDKST